MSVQNPAYTVTRWSVVGMEAMWAKMWDPPTDSPPRIDALPEVAQVVPDGKGGSSLIRPNPVPEVMFTAGYQNRPTVANTYQRDLLNGLTQPTWDGLHNLVFYLIGDPDNPAAKAGTYPGPTLRTPRGVIFNAEVQGKGPPPHTIHWHGTEPTPLNDGVGHCSMEIGKYFYQYQPNFMGFYFIHCHRNTMQHFEYGLYSASIFEAPDAYFGSIAAFNPDGTVVINADGTVNLKNLTQFPIGGGRDGKRRVACNLDDPLTGLPRFTQFPGFNRNPVDTPDPGPGPNDTQVSFPTDPHAMTVPFDVEALLVCDDRDSTWSDLAPNARATFPATGTIPGVNDLFQNNPGTNGFFAFNDFNADYWFITGVPVPARKGGSASIPPNLVIPPQLNGGITGTQISVNAQTGQVILLRILDAAYNFLRVTLPVDAVIIAWDGRALGVAPFGHNESYLVPAKTPIDMAVGRRFDALCLPTTPINDNIICEFINHKSLVPEAGEKEEVLMTARVPFVVSGNPQPPLTFDFIGQIKDQLGTPVAGADVTVTPKSLSGAPVVTVVTDAQGRYTVPGRTSGSYEVTVERPGSIRLTSPVSTHVDCIASNVNVPDIEVSIAQWNPFGYQLNEALDALRSIVGLKNPSNFEQLRYDVAPFVNAVPAPDGVLDIRDALDILRMVVGLPPV